uniref:NADH dehydrogenase subunit 6 n=1 Tax=Sphaeridium lunatum TaxID=878990 RepID=UPI0020286BB1|nr:NADH dehydrogenase subunit 6 [Sphaeridium lunatum]UPL65153.1 NADH dehydrogenase subunit 6 [Sphaeridium lunatum]
MLFVYISSLASLFIVFSTHPMSMGLTLLIQTICVALMTGFLANNFWFSYILFIVMVGGMLVLFIYMTSVASNEKFYFSKTLMFTFILLSFIMLISLFFMDNLITEYSSLFNINSDLNLNLNKYITYPYNIITIMMIFYLLITLIAVVKISKIKYGPLRHMN